MNVTPKDLLDAGVHFGHQTKRWNPRSKPYVFDHRQGITIIDLGKTHELLQKAYSFIEDKVAAGGNVLFVGTKEQAREIMREAATSTGMPFCVDRWLGGTLTNFATVKKSIAKFKKYQQQEQNGELAQLASKDEAATSLNMPMCVDRWLGGTLTNYETVKKSVAKFKKYQAMETNGEMAKLPRKEESAIKREMTRMQKNFNGIADMGGLPSAMFVVDVNHQKIAVAEGARAGIPCVGLVDTNSDPTTVSHPVPGNDDAVKSIRIIVETIVAAVQSGLAQRDSRRNNRAADLKAVSAAVAAAAGISDAPAAAAAEGDVSDAAPAAEAPVAKKPATRKKIAAPKA